MTSPPLWDDMGSCPCLGCSIFCDKVFLSSNLNIHQLYRLYHEADSAGKNKIHPWEINKVSHYCELMLVFFSGRKQIASLLCDTGAMSCKDKSVAARRKMLCAHGAYVVWCALVAEKTGGNYFCQICFTQRAQYLSTDVEQHHLWLSFKKRKKLVKWNCFKLRRNFSNCTMIFLSFFSLNDLFFTWCMSTSPQFTKGLYIIIRYIHSIDIMFKLVALLLVLTVMPARCSVLLTCSLFVYLALVCV